MKILISEIKNYSLAYLMEKNEDEYSSSLSLQKWAELSLKKLKNLTTSETLYLLNKGIGIYFLTIKLVEDLTQEGFKAYSFNQDDDEEQDNQKIIIKELLLINDSNWSINPKIYLKFKKFIQAEKDWIVDIIIPEYIFDHFINLNLQDISWTEKKTAKSGEIDHPIPV